MKKNNLIIVILLVVSIGFNISNANKMSQMKNDIGNLKYSLNNMQRSMDNIPASVNNSLRQFRGEQSWISPVNFDVVSIDKENIKFKADWQIKDFEKGSKVYFNHSLSDYKIAGISDGSGNFYVELDVEIDPQPIWINNVNRVSNGKLSVKEQEVKEEAKRRLDEAQRNKELEYFVSVESGDNIKASDKGTLSLSQFHSRLLGRLDSRMRVKLKGDLTLLEEVRLLHFFDYGKANQIEDVNIKIYNNGKLVSTEKLDKQAEHMYEDDEFFDLSFRDNPIPCTKIIMEIEYENGLKFSREIYN